MVEVVDVLIVGAGPVGLALAIELGSHGISCQVIERHDTVGYNPRAKMTNVRTREHLRRWGIADRLREVSPLSRDYPTDVVFATRMNGHELARFESAFSCTVERSDLYAEGAQWVPQNTLEEVLRAHAMSMPSVAIHFDHGFVGFAENALGLVSTVVHALSGTTREVQSRFLVGADGARSLLRKLIGVQLVGDGTSASNLNIVSRSTTLAKLPTHGPAIMY